MLDGFDEIEGQCRQSVIELIKAVTTNKPVRVYVTTRPHTAYELQLGLSQLVFTLDKLNEEDQIECMAKFWKEKIPESLDGERFDAYAKTLVTKVNASLNDSDRDFIGIPLQCRIVAECFLQEAIRRATQSTDSAGGGKDDELLHQEKEEIHFDLATQTKI